MEKEPFDLINIRNQWKLAGFRDFRVSRVGQRHECMLVLKDETSQTYSGIQYYMDKGVSISRLQFDNPTDLSDITDHMLFFRSRGWLPMKKKDLEITFCGHTAYSCAII